MNYTQLIYFVCAYLCAIYAGQYAFNSHRPIEFWLKKKRKVYEVEYIHENQLENPTHILIKNNSSWMTTNKAYDLLKYYS